MEIRLIEAKPRGTLFEELHPGSVFRVAGHVGRALFMKITSGFEERAVWLTSGETVHWQPDAEVEIVTGYFQETN